MVINRIPHQRRLFIHRSPIGRAREDGWIEYLHEVTVCFSHLIHFLLFLIEDSERHVLH